MRKCKLLLLAAALMLCRTAQADFSYSYERVEAGGGLDRVSFYALSDLNTAPDVGTQVLGADLTIRDLLGNNLVVKFEDDGTDPITPDLTGAFAPDPYHSDRSFINLLGDPSNHHDSNPRNAFVIGTTPASTFSNYANGVWEFETTLILGLTGGVNATSTANEGRGALIAVAVVPSGDPVQLFGLLGGALPDSPPRNVNIITPEPTGVVLLGIVGLLLRNRQ